MARLPMSEHILEARYCAVIEDTSNPSLPVWDRPKQYIGPFDYPTTISMRDQKVYVRVRAWRVPDEEFP